MAYSMRGVVADRSHLDLIVAGDARLKVVELDYPPFALLPLTERAATACLEKWGVTLFDDDFYDLLDPAIAVRLMENLSAAASGAPLAFVEAYSGGDAGVAFGLAVGCGPHRHFDRDPDPWPDTNISMALKAIGVPERLDLRMDAFDVVGLGRKRSIEAWLKPDEPWERRRKI